MNPNNLINLDSLQKHLDQNIPEEVLLDSSTELTLLPDLTKQPSEIVLSGQFEDITEIEASFDSHNFDNPVVNLWEEE